MAGPRHLEDVSGVVLLVGTTKGAFLLASDGARERWRLAGPYFPGEAVYAMALDTRRGRRRLLVATSHNHFGAVVSLSDDLGRTFSVPERAPIRFPEGSGESLAKIWQLALGEASGDVVYAGVEPAALFVSRDAGETWALNEALFSHPQRKEWQPGGGGLCLHTVLELGGGRLMCAVSTAGAYRSDDGGASWRPRNVGIRAAFLPPGHQYPEFGQCVHKVAPSAAPGRLYLQHHFGVYRSDDGGDTWRDVGAGDRGLPSDFGFPVVAHPRDADMAWLLPLEADMNRVTPDGRLRVYRTRDGGESWHALGDGLPQEHAYECVLRDGMAADARDPAGLYFGTRGGKLFASADEGARWRMLEGGLPPIVCVKAVDVGGV